MICKGIDYLEQDYILWVDWYGEKRGVFNLEEWFDIESVDLDDSVKPIYNKSYEVVVYAEGRMDDDALFYDFSNFTIKIKSTGGLRDDLSNVKCKFTFDIVNKAFNRFLESTFYLDSKNMNTWDWLW